jgi:hypothetical protein
LLLLLEAVGSLEVGSAIEVGEFGDDFKGEGEVSEYVEDDESIDLSLGVVDGGLLALQVGDGKE